MTQFIATEHKLARLWVDACGKSLGIERAEAAAMYANMCGFTGSYPTFIQKCE